MVCSPPGSSVHGILQARILEWVAMPFSWESAQSRNWTWISCIASRFFTIWATREAQSLCSGSQLCFGDSEKASKREIIKLTLERQSGVNLHSWKRQQLMPKWGGMRARSYDFEEEGWLQPRIPVTWASGLRSGRVSSSRLRNLLSLILGETLQDF